MQTRHGLDLFAHLKRLLAHSAVLVRSLSFSNGFQRQIGHRLRICGRLLVAALIEELIENILEIVVGHKVSHIGPSSSSGKCLHQILKVAALNKLRGASKLANHLLDVAKHLLHWIQLWSSLSLFVTFSISWRCGRAHQIVEKLSQRVVVCITVHRRKATIVHVENKSARSIVVVATLLLLLLLIVDCSLHLLKHHLKRILLLLPLLSCSLLLKHLNKRVDGRSLLVLLLLERDELAGVVSTFFNELQKVVAALWTRW